jgi:TubC N-terminal docking domain
MNATTILKTLRRHGGEVTLDGDNIRIHKARDVLTDELRQAIRAEKAAIMTILAAEHQRAQVLTRLTWTVNLWGAAITIRHGSGGRACR